MSEYFLNEFGIPEKTDRKPRLGIKKGGQILHKFDEEYGPVREYSEFLGKKMISGSFETFLKDYAWLKDHLGKIADFTYKEYGIDRVNMSAYFVILSGADHDCVQINFPYENTVLNYHYNGPNFAQYFTSTISEDFASYRQKDLVNHYFIELMNSIPDHQLIRTNWIEPKFISNYAFDGDPHLTLEMELDFEGIQQDNSGIYSDLFIRERERFPFFPFQPIFAGKKEETAVIILPMEELFNIGEFKKEIANRLNIDPGKIKIDRRYDFKIAIEDIMYSVGLPTVHNIRIKYRNPTEISASIANDFLLMSQQGIRCAHESTASDYIKGKDTEGIEEGLVKRILDSYQNPSFVTPSSAIFGPPENLTYFSDQLRLEMNSRFRKFKEKKLGQ